MAIDTQRLRELMIHCMLTGEEVTPDGKIAGPHIMVRGIMSTYAMHPERVAASKEEIRAMLRQVPSDFHVDSGGGMSFLNMCMDKDGVQWGEHRNMEELVVLGIAAGMADYCMPEEYWRMLPGGMPYIQIDTKETSCLDPRKTKSVMTLEEAQENATSTTRPSTV